MRKPDAFFFFAATLASFVSACSENNPRPTTVQEAGVQAGDAGGALPTGPTGQTSMDAGSPPAMMPTGMTGAGNDAGAPLGDAATDAGAVGDSALGSGEGGRGDSGMAGSGDPEFDTCYAQVKPTCVAKEMNTAALMETACKALTNIPLPLTDGGTYGPTTVTGGPYAGKAEWNEGMGTAFVNEVNFLEEICVPVGIDTFAEPASVVAELKNLRDLDWSLYTIFRPACFKKGEKYPVITWANGTCGEIAGYAALLTAVASHGFVVIAPNSTWTATPPTDGVQLRALDYAKALNEDSKSIFYQRLDLDHIGAMGHSQGAGATGTADDDPRVKAAIYWNTGTSNEKPFLNISGERDVSTTTPASMTESVNAATKPGGWVYFHKIPQTGGTSTGHLTLMEQPERVVDLTVAWWKWQLKSDAEAKKMFIGTDCGLCKTPAEFEYGHNTLLQ